MSKRRTPGLTKRRRTDGSYEWHIDKRIRGYGRICESTGTSDVEEAGRVLARRIEQIRQATVFGVRPRRIFRAAATKYLTEYRNKKSIGRDATALKDLDAFIGDLPLDAIHDGTFDRYREARKGLAVGTINRNLAAPRRILKLAARVWRDEGSNLTWLAEAPLICLPTKYKRRPPYPIDWQEQRLMFQELAPHLERMALFKVNTGLRDQEVCGLEWEWEIRVPELDTPTIKRSVFVIPGDRVKNTDPRVVVLNDTAQAVVENVRGQHPRYVFTYQAGSGRRRALARMNAAGWRAARRRAAKRYAQELGKEPAEGFRLLRVHDLKHTFGRRLRAAGVSFEDRQDLLGHRSERITTHYSAAEIGRLLDGANRVLQTAGATLTLLRVGRGGLTASRLGAAGPANLPQMVGKP